MICTLDLQLWIGGILEWWDDGTLGESHGVFLSNVLALVVVVDTAEGSLDWARGRAGRRSADTDTAARLDQALSSLWAVAGGVAGLEVSAPSVLEAESATFSVRTAPAVETWVASLDEVAAGLGTADLS